MSFDSTTIGLSINGNTPQATWRQDAAAGNSIVASLSSAIGVNTYSWQLVGRPEGSTAGGTGPEPCSLGTATTCSFTVDIPGTYIVSCLLNGGATDATIITAGIAILETTTTGDGRSLRLLGPGETNQDIHDPLVAQGWIKELNRWLRYLSSVSGGGGGSDHLVLVNTGGIYGTLSAVIMSADGSVVAAVDPSSGKLNLSAVGSLSPATLYYLAGTMHASPTQLTRVATLNANYYAASLTSSYAAILVASAPASDPGLIALPAGTYKLKLWCFAGQASTVYFTVSMGGGVGVVATSAPVNLATGSTLTEITLIATSTIDQPVPDTTQPIVLTIWAKQNTGSGGTLTVGDGVSTLTSLTVPFASNHAYTHLIAGNDALPAASTSVAGLIALDRATLPQPNGIAAPGSSTKTLPQDHVHAADDTVNGDLWIYQDETSAALFRSPSPDTGDSLSVAITSSSPGYLFQNAITPLGDPNLVTWKAGVARFRLSVGVTAVSGTPSAELLATLSRVPAAGGAGTALISGVSLGTITNTSLALLSCDLALPASAGASTDVIALTIQATTTNPASTTVTIGCSAPNPSSINLPIAIPAGAGTFSGTATGLQTATTVVAISASAAPTNGDVLVASGSSTAAWVAMPDTTATGLRAEDGSIVHTEPASPPSAGQVLTAVSPTAATWQTPTAAALASASTTVNVSAATAPTEGQVLTATSGTTAGWQTPDTGATTAQALATTGSDVVVNTAAPPIAGQALIATSPTAAAWAMPFPPDLQSYAISEDFMGGALLLAQTANGAAVGAATCVDLSGTYSATSRIVDTTTGRAGVIEANASITNGYCRVDTTENFYKLQTGQFVFETFVRVPALGGLSEFQVYAGWNVANIGTGSPHFALVYNEEVSTHWIFECDVSGAKYSFDTSVTVTAGQWYRLTFVLDGSNVNVLIDEVAIRTEAWSLASGTGGQFTAVGVTNLNGHAAAVADCDKYNLWSTALGPSNTR